MFSDFVMTDLRMNATAAIMKACPVEVRVSGL